MVHTSNAIITATLALSAAAPILAAPVGPRIDSGFSSVNSRAPISLPPTQPLATDEAVAAPASSPALEAPAKEISPGIGPVVVGDGAPATALNLVRHLFSRAGSAEAGVPPISIAPNHRDLDADELYLEARGGASADGRPTSSAGSTASSSSESSSGSSLKNKLALGALTTLLLTGVTAGVVAPIAHLEKAFRAVALTDMI